MSYLNIYIIFALDYSGIMYSFTQGGIGVHCPPLCALMAPYVDFFCRGLLLFRVPVTDSAVYTGVVGGLGWCGGI